MRASPPISFLASAHPHTRLSRYFFWCYLLVVLLVSFYPFTDWRYTGEPVFASIPTRCRTTTRFFDNAINVLAYVPLGIGASLMIRRWPALAWLISALVCVLVSCGVEFVQQFIPSRVASNMDIFSNGVGGLIGAVGAWLARAARAARLAGVSPQTSVSGRRGGVGAGLVVSVADYAV